MTRPDVYTYRRYYPQYRRSLELAAIVSVRDSEADSNIVSDLDQSSEKTLPYAVFIF